MTEIGRELDREVRRRRIVPATRQRAERFVERRLEDRISRGWAFGTAAAWAAAITMILLIEPAPADPEAASVLANVLGTAIAVGLSATALGLLGRYRFGLGATAATGAVMLVTALACPATGHHTFGAWWFGELAIVSGLATLGIVGYRRATGTGE